MYMSLRHIEILQKTHESYQRMIEGGFEVVRRNPGDPKNDKRLDAIEGWITIGGVITDDLGFARQSEAILRKR